LTKSRHVGSLEAFLQLVFTACKVAILAHAYFNTPVAMAWYLILFLILQIVIPLPKVFSSGEILTLTPTSFAPYLVKSSRSPSILVFFSAPQNNACVSFASTFSSLSSQVLVSTSKRLQFGTVDVTSWPTVAQELDVDVTTLGTPDLPCLLLIEKGKVEQRFPGVTPKQVKFLVPDLLARYAPAK